MFESISFSVIIPLYNKERHIVRAVESVLNQNYKAFELIVVNDGSTDGSIRAIKSHLPNIRLIEQPNKGESAARNAGIYAASNTYIAFLDADDEWDEDFLQTHAGLIRAKPDRKLFCTNYRKKIGDQVKVAISLPVDKVLELDFFELARHGTSPVTSSSVCVRSDLFEEVCFFPEQVKLYPDLYLWTRFSLDHSFVFHSTPKATYHRDADNRVCNVVIPSVNDTPFEETILDAVNQGILSGERQTHALQFLCHYKLLNAFKAATQCQQLQARSILTATKAVTTKQLLRKHMLMTLTFLPERATHNLWRRWKSK